MDQDSVDLVDFFLSLLVYIRPEMIIDLDTFFLSLKLENIDYTLISIECEEKYKVVVDEKKLQGCLRVQDAIVYLEELLEEKKKNYYDLIHS
jgi:acyl carrier protein